MQPEGDSTRKEYANIVFAVRKDFHHDSRKKFAERITNALRKSGSERKITPHIIRSWENGKGYPELQARLFIDKWHKEMSKYLNEIEDKIINKPDKGPPFLLNFFEQHIPKPDLEQKLQRYRGKYLCYYDLWGHSETTHQPYLSLRRYTIDSIVPADGSLVGTFLSSSKASGSLLHGSRFGTLKFVMTPDHRDLFYVVEHDLARPLPPITGIVRAHDAHGLPYFYGMLLRFRGDADGPIAAVKCLILRHDFPDDDDFRDEITEDTIGDPEKWKSLKYIFCGIHKHDSPGRLQASPDVSVILGKHEPIDIKINKIVEKIYERKILSQKHQEKTSVPNEDSEVLRPDDREYINIIRKLIKYNK